MVGIVLKLTPMQEAILLVLQQSKEPLTCAELIELVEKDINVGRSVMLWSNPLGSMQNNVNSLRNKGYTIETVNRKGYKLVQEVITH